MRSALRLTLWSAVISTIMLLAVPALAAQTDGEICPSDLNLNLPIQGVVLESTASRAELDFTVCNGSSRAQEVAFVTSGTTKGWSVAVRPNFGPYDITNLTLAPSDSKDYRLRITPPAGDKSKAEFTIKFQIVDKSGSVIIDEDVSVKKLAGEAAAEGGIALVSTYSALKGPSASIFEFEVQVKNGTSNDLALDLSSRYPDNWDVNFTPAYGEEKLISSVSLTPNGSQRVKVRVATPYFALPGEHPVFVIAENDDYNAMVDLKVTLTGTSNAEISSSTGQLNFKSTAGKQTDIELLINNLGSAELKDLKLSANMPQDWQVTFEPNVVDLARDFEIRPKLKITPPDNAVPGDYMVKITAKNADTTSTVDLRITVKQSTIWQIFGIAILVLVIGGMLLVFVRLGRR